MSPRTLRFQSLSAGTDITCGVTIELPGLLLGGRRSGQLGDGTTTEVRLTPVRTGAGLYFRQVVVGNGLRLRRDRSSTGRTAGETMRSASSAMAPKTKRLSASPGRRAGFSFQQVTAGTRPHVRDHPGEQRVLLGQQQRRHARQGPSTGQEVSRRSAWPADSGSARWSRASPTPAA